MTSPLDSHTTTEFKPEIIPHDKYNIRGMAHRRTNRIDAVFMQRRLYIDEAHMVLDIFR